MTTIFDLADPPEGFFENPFPFYRALRESAPIADDGNGGILLSRYEDLVTVYRDSASYLSDKEKEFAPKFGDGPLFQHHTTSLVFNDDPYHARVRKRLVGALSPRALVNIEGLLKGHCEAMVDRWIDQGQVDVIEHFAGAIPIRVIGDMLGVPEQDRGQLRAWSLAILGALEPQLSAEQLDTGNAAVATFAAYLEDLIGDRRMHPGDPETDLLTRLIQGEGEPLSGEELVHNAIFLLNAGHETTTNLIGSALNIWSARPELDLSDPNLCGTFIEEVLRCESPNQLGNRRAATDLNLSGHNIPAGTNITLLIGAANRDPDAFVDPETFDPERTPNRHLAFGMGNHQCAGLSLARIEARIAIAAIGDRGLRPVLSSPPVRQRRVRFRSIESLLMTLSE